MSCACRGRARRTPVQPIEVMVGKIAPYIVIGYIQLGVILGAAALLLTGCHGADLGLAAEQSLRWVGKVDDAAALSALLYAGSTHGHTPEEMVEQAIPAVTGALTPGCLAAPKVEGARVTFVFQACAGLEGSHGVRDLQGTVAAIGHLRRDRVGKAPQIHGFE